MSQSERRDEAIDFGIYALIASVNVVKYCEDVRRSRLAGADPTCQESRTVALARALGLSVDVERACVRLRMHLLFDTDSTSPTGVGRAFEWLLIARRCSQDLRVLHQTLMSLFPEVSAETIEAVRIAATEMANIWLDDRERSPGNAVTVVGRVQDATRVCRGDLRSMEAIRPKTPK